MKTKAINIALKGILEEDNKKKSGFGSSLFLNVFYDVINSHYKNNFDVSTFKVKDISFSYEGISFKLLENMLVCKIPKKFSFIDENENYMIADEYISAIIFVSSMISRFFSDEIENKNSHFKMLYFSYITDDTNSLKSSIPLLQKAIKEEIESMKEEGFKIIGFIDEEIVKTTGVKKYDFSDSVLKKFVVERSSNHINTSAFETIVKIMSRNINEENSNIKMRNFYLYGSYGTSHTVREISALYKLPYIKVHMTSYTDMRSLIYDFDGEIKVKDSYIKSIISEGGVIEIESPENIKDALDFSILNTLLKNGVYGDGTTRVTRSKDCYIFFTSKDTSTLRNMKYNTSSSFGLSLEVKFRDLASTVENMFSVSNEFSTNIIEEINRAMNLFEIQEDIDFNSIVNFFDLFNSGILGIKDAYKETILYTLIMKYEVRKDKQEAYLNKLDKNPFFFQEKDL